MTTAIEHIPCFTTEINSIPLNLSAVKFTHSQFEDICQANGVRLGWLIDPQHQCVEIYRLDRETEVLRSPTQLDGENILPGFVLGLAAIW